MRSFPERRNQQQSFHLMAFRRLHVCAVVVLDDKLEEANPFSFKEFLKTKNLSLSKEDTANSRLYPKVRGRSLP